MKKSKSHLSYWLKTIALIIAISIITQLILPSLASNATNETTLTFSDTGITETVSGSGYSIDGTNLTISAAGTYRVTGYCSEGSIVVAKSLTGVNLILDNLTLTSSTTAPIVIKKSTTTTINL